MRERYFFQTEREDPGCQFVGVQGADTATITNSDDCCGDTESGLGASVTIELSRDDAKRLSDTIMEWLRSNVRAKRLP